MLEEPFSESETSQAATRRCDVKKLFLFLASATFGGINRRPFLYVTTVTNRCFVFSYSITRKYVHFYEDREYTRLGKYILSILPVEPYIQLDRAPLHKIRSDVQSCRGV